MTMTDMILTAFAVAAFAATGKPPVDYKFVPNINNARLVFRSFVRTQPASIFIHYLLTLDVAIRQI